MTSEKWRFTAGEYRVTQHKLETVGRNIEGQWPTQMWIHQRKVNNLLMSLIGDLKKRVEELETKSNS